MALLGVKLRCKQVLLRQCRATCEAVIKGACDHSVVIGHYMVAVNKIKTRAGLDVAPQGVIDGRPHGVPAHVRHLQPLTLVAAMRRAKEGNLARQHIKAVDAAIFLRVRHQGLHADANGQHRLAVHVQHLIQQLITAEATDRFHTVTDAPNTWENNPVSVKDSLRFMADHDLGRSNVLQRARHRVEVAHAVIDYGNPLGHGLQNPFGRGAGASHRCVGRDRHAQRPAKRLEYGLGLVVCIVAAEIIDVHRHVGVVHEALKKFDY